MRYKGKLVSIATQAVNVKVYKLDPEGNKIPLVSIATQTVNVKVFISTNQKTINPQTVSIATQAVNVKV